MFPISHRTVTRRGFLQTSAAAAIVAGSAAYAQNAPAPADAKPADPPNDPKEKIGFALVGLGRLSIGQLLPAFAACKNARVTALVSGHPDKAKDLAAKFGVNEKSIYNYENFDTIRDNPDVDVVYVVLPNSMHHEYTLRAAKAGKHVLCEKPMAINVQECQEMIDACKAANRKLMIGYRLRYEPYNMKAIEICRGKTHGPTRVIEAAHSFNIGQNEWRTQKALAGGGPLMDLGIYCLNATRYLTGEEPATVTAQTWNPTDDPRFKDTEATMAFSLKFPSGILANCTTSYAHHYATNYRFMTDQSLIQLEPAFAYGNLKMTVKERGKTEAIELPNINQFAAEMDHFAQCIKEDKQPLTPGEEGLADVKVMRKLYEAAETGKTVMVS